jgi:hypothetical protein
MSYFTSRGSRAGWRSRCPPAPPPVPASSGCTSRHRLKRLGDRQLNRGRGEISGWVRCHPPVLACVQRRRAEGKTGREIRCCITARGQAPCR